MLKALLLASVLAWPFTAIAQDAPATPDATPDAAAAATAKIVGKICAMPITKVLGETLAAKYAIGMIWDTPLTENLFVRNGVYEEKVPDEKGVKQIIELATFMTLKGEVIEQCVSSYGAYEVAPVDAMKKHWAEHPTAGQDRPAPDKSSDAPLTNPPVAGTATTPSFQANPDE
jgi:hypothetical protein